MDNRSCRTLKYRFGVYEENNNLIEIFLFEKTIMQLTAVYMKTSEGYVGFVEELPGANTQGSTLDEARENLKEAVSMVLEANRAITERMIEGRSGSQ